MSKHRPKAVVLALLVAGCGGTGSPQPDVSPRPAADQRNETSWSGQTDQKPGCPPLSFSLKMLNNATLEGWVHNPASRPQVSQVKGAVERNDAVLVVENTIWFGAHTDSELALVEPTQCRRRVVMTVNAAS